MKTNEEIKARHDAIRNGEEEEIEIFNTLKIINSTCFREICHKNEVKISEEALKEFANMNRKILMQAITDTKEMGAKIILRRYVEKLVV